MLRYFAIFIGSITFPAAMLLQVAPVPDQDVRCMLLSNFFASKELVPQKKRLASDSFFFYLGKVSLRFNTEQLKSQIMAIQRNPKQEVAAQMMTGCANALQAQRRSLLLIGKEVDKPAVRKAPI